MTHYSQVQKKIKIQVNRPFLKHGNSGSVSQQVRLLSKQEIIAERRELFQIINGDAFFPLKWWPEEYQRMFWAKPIGDKETFKLMMFCLGNGCAPHLISQWIILSQSWLPTKAEKRTRQLDFILNNADVKRHTLVLL